MSTVIKDLGAVSAYAYAVEKGYTGTEAEFAELMADYAEVGQRAEDAAESALNSKTAAQTAATTATNKASEATTAATTATTKAGEASTSASTATSAKDTAVSASQTATSKAAEATTAAATATSAKTDAVAANTAAQSAKTAAQTAQTGAETAAASVQSSAAQIQTNADDISELKEDLNLAYTEHLLNGYDEFTESGYYDTDGSVLESTSFKRSETYVRVKPNTTYSLWRNRDNNYYSALSSGGIVFFDANKDALGRIANTASFTSPNNAAYARCYVNSGYVDYPMFIEGTTTPTTYVPFGYDVITAYEDKLGANYSDGFANQLDLIDGLSIAGGTKEYSLTAETPVDTLSGYIGKVGVLNPTTGWQARKFAVKASTLYKYKCYGASAAFGLYMYDVKGRVIKRIPDTASSGTFTGFIKTPDDAEYIILNEQSNTASLEKVTGINYAVNNAETDILSGKKLYCAGDSITEGAGVGSFSDGYKKTYGGYVAERNGMTYASDGIGGSTMGNVTVAGSSRHGFCVSRYLDIPADADYITIWFGWNDYAYGGQGLRDSYCMTQYGKYYNNLTDAEKAEVDAYKNWSQWLTAYVGTPDDNVDTTWCGAWNKVLTWLLANRGTARIGAVVAYGTSDDLANALINMCEKYGITYIKAYDPHEFFSVGHSKGIGSTQATTRKSLYTLDNTHPNELGYEMMSTSFEQFLRRL